MIKKMRKGEGVGIPKEVESPIIGNGDTSVSRGGTRVRAPAVGSMKVAGNGIFSADRATTHFKKTGL